jgi:hypothetical protein
MSDESSKQASEATADREPRVHSGTSGMWVGPLLPAITWAVQMQLNYWLIRGACARGSNTPMYTTFLIAIVLVCVAGLGCWLAWLRVKRVWPDAYRDKDVRNRFLAVLGLLMAGTFLLVIIAQGVATIVFDPCQL